MQFFSIKDITHNVVTGRYLTEDKALTDAISMLRRTGATEFFCTLEPYNTSIWSTVKDAKGTAKPSKILFQVRLSGAELAARKAAKSVQSSESKQPKAEKPTVLKFQGKPPKNGWYSVASSEPMPFTPPEELDKLSVSEGAIVFVDMHNIVLKCVLVQATTSAFRSALAGVRANAVVEPGPIITAVAVKRGIFAEYPSHAYAIYVVYKANGAPFVTQKRLCSAPLPESASVVNP